MAFTNSRLFFVAIAVSVTIQYVTALNILVPGGTGKVGRILLPKLAQHDVTVLSRNAFLASAPGRVTNVFGYLGASFLENNRHVRLRDWDGGDLLDIVGKDWLGWQEDSLKNADVVIHLVGDYTPQREMATERLVRESLRFNPDAFHIVVLPREEDIPVLTPGMLTLKKTRLDNCAKLVEENLKNTVCLRVEANRVEDMCEIIKRAVEDRQR